MNRRSRFRMVYHPAYLGLFVTEDRAAVVLLCAVCRPSSLKCYSPCFAFLHELGVMPPWHVQTTSPKYHERYCSSLSVTAKSTGSTDGHTCQKRGSMTVDVSPPHGPCHATGTQALADTMTWDTRTERVQVAHVANWHVASRWWPGPGVGGWARGDPRPPLAGGPSNRLHHGCRGQRAGQPRCTGIVLRMLQHCTRTSIQGAPTARRRDRQAPRTSRAGRSPWWQCVSAIGRSS